MNHVAGQVKSVRDKLLLFSSCPSDKLSSLAYCTVKYPNKNKKQSMQSKKRAQHMNIT